VLHFQSGLSQRMRMTVRYEDYKQFKSETLIKYGEGRVQRRPRNPEPD